MGRDRHIERAARREALIDAAVSCIRREGAGASMEDIAREAGVTKPILYRYFRHRAELEDAIATRFTGDISARMRRVLTRDGHPLELLVDAIDAYVQVVERDTEVYRFLVHGRPTTVAGDDAIQNFMRRLGDEIGLVLGERARELNLDSGPAEVWGHGIVGMVAASVDWWVDRRVLPRKRLVEFLASLLWGGFRDAMRADPGHPEADAEAPVAPVIELPRRKS